MLDTIAKVVRESVNSLKVRVVILIKTDYDQIFLLCQRVGRIRAGKLAHELEKQIGGFPKRIEDVPLPDDGKGEIQYWIVTEALDYPKGVVRIDPDDPGRFNGVRSVSVRNLEHLLTQLQGS